MTDRAAFRAQLLVLYGQKSDGTLAKYAAQDFGVTSRTVQRWLRGEVRLPRWAIKFMRLLLHQFWSFDLIDTADYRHAIAVMPPDDIPWWRICDVEP